MAPGTVFYQADRGSLILGVLVLVIIVAIIYMVATGQIQIGTVVAQPSGDAYVMATLEFADYFGNDDNLPETVTITLFDIDQKPILLTTINLDETKSITTVDFEVPVNRPKFYINIEVQHNEPKMWYVIYPPEVNDKAPVMVSEYKVYPVNLRDVLGQLKPNQEYSYVMNILLAKTFNYMNLQLPTTLNMTAGYEPTKDNPMAIGVNGQLIAPEYEAIFKGIVLYIEVQENITPTSLVFDGKTYEVDEINETTYKVYIGDVEFPVNVTTKTLSIGLDVEAKGSFLVTVKVEGLLPTGEKKVLATASTTINIS